MVRLIKDTTKSALGKYFSYLPSVKKKLNESLSVFVFHDVTNTPSEFDNDHGLAVSESTFRTYIQWINSHFNIIHPALITESTELPVRPALITFDDGFVGTFTNGLRILKELDIPSIVFLNMKAILDSTPIMSSLACYLGKHSLDFKEFARKKNIPIPYHLSLNPSLLENFVKDGGEVDYQAVTKYQGVFANIDIVNSWNDKSLVVYGNHLYCHWNAVALNAVEFEQEYKLNEEALKKISNYIPFFAFPNGQPVTCFSGDYVSKLHLWNAQKVFSADGKANNDSKEFLLSRISLGPIFNENRLWYLLAKSIK